MRVSIGSAARDATLMFLGFFVVVAAVFTLHVAVSPHPPNAHTDAGQKDLRFVSPTYLAYLEGRRSLSPQVVVAAATDYAMFMAADQAGVPKTDAHGSHPLQWPLHRKAINYRWDSDGQRTAYSQLAGNPIGWWAALAVTIAAIALVLRGARHSHASGQSERLWLMTSLLALYVVFLATHIVLDTHRVLYLYHFFPALLIAFCLCPLILQNRSTLYILAALHLAAFLFYAPLAFHRPLTTVECERRNILQPIVDCR